MALPHNPERTDGESLPQARSVPPLTPVESAIIDSVQRSVDALKDSEQVDAPRLSEKISDGSLLYVHCLPHQSKEFSQLHGCPVRVVFKTNPVFNPALVKKYERQFKRPFAPVNVLMVVKTSDALSPFIIPREFLYENQPPSTDTIHLAGKSIKERPGDVIKYVTGGAKQMAKSQVNQAIRDTSPKAIVLSPSDDRYNAAHYFIAFKPQFTPQQSRTGTQYDPVLCFLPDHLREGNPIVWVLDAETFLSDSPFTSTSMQQLSEATGQEKPNMLLSRRLSFNRDLSRSTKALFTEDDLCLEGTIASLSDVPSDHVFSDEEKDLLSRGTSVACVLFIPKYNKYICVERKWLTMCH